MSGFRHTSDAPTLYPIAGATADAEVAAKLLLIQRADKAARTSTHASPRSRAGFSDELRRILVAASDGTFASDTQPLARLNIFVIAKDAAADNGAGSTARGTSGGGGRVTLDFFEGTHSPEHFAREAARTAILQLEAVAAPAGEMPVVLGPGWRESCCTKPSATAWKRTSTARRPPPCRPDRAKGCQREGHSRRQRQNAQSPRVYHLDDEGNPPGTVQEEPVLIEEWHSQRICRTNCSSRF